MDREALEARLRSYEGREIGPPETGPDPVNAPMIRHFCEAVGDDSPAYLDEAFAAGSAHEGLVAPPAMLQAWVLRGLRPAPHDLLNELLDLLREAGLSGIVATDCEQSYPRYLRPGDRITQTTRIERISAEKTTGLGLGRFIDTRMTYRDQRGEPVGTQLFRLFVFAAPERGPGEQPAALERPRRPAPPVNEDNRFFHEGLARGELRIQRCTACGRLRHPPRPMCPACQSLSHDFVLASRRGTLHSYTVLHHPQFPPFAYPLTVALVDLEEGTRLVADLEGAPPEGPTIGMALEAEIREVEEGLWLPVFVPAGSLRRPEEYARPVVLAAKAPRVPLRRESKLSFDAVSPGLVLPPLDIPLTVTGIVAGALASRDYQDVHHDVAAARRQGLPNVFMNILTTNGYVGRFVTDWAGPEARIVSIAIRLGAPNLPGDTCTLTGEVTEIDATTGELSVRVEGRNGFGSHVNGIVCVAIPGARS